MATSLELLALQRQNQLLQQRLDAVETVLEHSGLIDAVLQGQTPATIPLGPLGGDPGPDDIGRARLSGWLLELLRGGRRPGPVGPNPGDPAAFDLSRFNRGQLEASLHDIAAQRARLDSIEESVKGQLNALGNG